jgi:hypothetical protein
MPDHPVPTSHHLTQRYYPGPQQIADAILDLMNKDRSGVTYKKLEELLKVEGMHDIPHREYVGPF